MKFLEILDIISNLSSLDNFENTNYLKTYWCKMNDSNEYLGERIIAFCLFVFVIVLYLFVISLVCFLAYVFIN